MIDLYGNFIDDKMDTIKIRELIKGDDVIKIKMTVTRIYDTLNGSYVFVTYVDGKLHYVNLYPPYTVLQKDINKYFFETVIISNVVEIHRDNGNIIYQTIYSPDRIEICNEKFGEQKFIIIK